MTEPDYREIILSRLKERNAASQRFAELVQSHNQLYEEVSGLKHSKFQLSIQLEKLKEDNLNLQVKAEAGGGGEKSERYVAIEQKLFRAQEELTEVHRTKGANAQQLINLNLALQETEKEKNVINDQLQEKISEVTKVQDELEDLKEKYEKSLQANQTIHDEHNALHLMCTSLETKLRESQAENAELVQQLIDLKNLQAEQIEKERKDVNLSRKDSVNSTTNQTPSTTTKTTSNGGPQTAEGSPQKSRFPFTRIGEAMQDFFSKPKPNPQAQHNECQETRSPTRQGCVYVTVPSIIKCKWKTHEGEVTSVKYSASGDTLATGGSDKLIRLWTIVGDKAVMEHALRGSNGGITNIDFDPTEQILIACSSDYAVRLWTTAIQRLKLTLTGHSGKVLSARYLGYGHKLVSGSNDRTVKLWDVKSGSCVKTYLAGSSCNDIVTTDQSGECVASGHFDRKLRFYDLRISIQYPFRRVSFVPQCALDTSTSICKLYSGAQKLGTGASANFELTLGGRITSLDTPLDKNSILCCTKDHTLEIVDMRKRTVLHSFSHDLFKVATDHSRCAYSPDGEYVAAGSSDGTVLVWNAKKGSIETTVHEHNDPVLCCSWNSGQLLTGDRGKHCILWAGT